MEVYMILRPHKTLSASSSIVDRRHGTTIAAAHPNVDRPYLKNPTYKKPQHFSVHLLSIMFLTWLAFIIHPWWNPSVQWFKSPNKWTQHVEKLKAFVQNLHLSPKTSQNISFCFWIKGKVRKEMDSNTPICYLSSLIILLQVVLLGRTKEKEEVQKIVSEDEISPPTVEEL